MARSRNIKPGFFRNADLVELPMEARLLFVGIWTLADRAGRLEDRPKQIKMEIFPADNVDCDALIALLAGTGMLVRYEVGGKRYLQVTNFVKHQNPHRDEKASTIPDQCGNHDAVDAARCKHGASTVQAKCNVDADTVAIGLNPDVLNPESRILIPDSPTHTARVAGEAASAIDPDPGSPNPGQPDFTPSMAAAVCMAIKSSGVGGVNPSHPDLTLLLQQGADIGQFAAAALVAVQKGKGFAYVLGIVRGQIADAQSAAGRAVTGAAIRPGVAAETAHARMVRERAEQFAPGIAIRPEVPNQSQPPYTVEDRHGTAIVKV